MKMVGRLVSVGRAAVELLTRGILFLVKTYQRYISPALPPRCRFTPSCSAYAVEAIERFGLTRGAYLAVRRLLRCHPWHRGGHDPVPPIVGTPVVTVSAAPAPALSSSDINPHRSHRSAA